MDRQKEGDHPEKGPRQRIENEAKDEAKSPREDNARQWLDMGVERCHRSRKFVMPQEHYHSYYELYYLISGRCRLFLNHTFYHLEPGCLVLIPPQEIHATSYRTAQESERIAFCFSPLCREQMEREFGGSLEALFETRVLQMKPERRVYLDQIFEHLQAEQQHTDPFSALMRQTYFQELFTFWGRSIEAMDELGEEPATRFGSRVPCGQGHQEVAGGSMEATIEQAARFLSEHYREPLTLQQVADQVHLSAPYFSRRFKGVTGLGCREYLVHVRLREAKRLLLGTKMGIAQISQACGFSDANYFGDVFKRETGISPRQYRKNPQVC